MYSLCKCDVAAKAAVSFITVYDTFVRADDVRCGDVQNITPNSVYTTSACICRATAGDETSTSDSTRSAARRENNFQQWKSSTGNCGRFTHRNKIASNITDNWALLTLSFIDDAKSTEQPSAAVTSAIKVVLHQDLSTGHYVSSHAVECTTVSIQR